MSCECEHNRLSHTYDTTARANVGPCLSRGCECGAGSAQNPQGIRGKSVSLAYTGGTTKAAPGGASTPLIQGPRRSNKEID